MTVVFFKLIDQIACVVPECNFLSVICDIKCQIRAHYAQSDQSYIVHSSYLHMCLIFIVY